jgi:hypothetical protein
MCVCSVYSAALCTNHAHILSLTHTGSPTHSSTRHGSLNIRSIDTNSKNDPSSENFFAFSPSHDQKVPSDIKSLVGKKNPKYTDVCLLYIRVKRSACMCVL